MMLPLPFVVAPFPNSAQCAMATGFSTKVMIDGKPALNTGSEIPLSNGDEPGVLMGVVSSTIMQKVVYRQGVQKVQVDGKPIVTVLKPTAHNGANANAPMGAQVAPSQTKVIILG